MTRTSETRITTGIDGLDEILHGGFIPEQSYMVRGEPGTGKSILGSHFLTADTQAHEPGLYIALEESEAALRRNTRSAGLDLDGVEVLDLTPESDVFAEDESYDIFEPADVEQDALIERITDRVDAIEPGKVFIDPITQLQFLTSDQYQFRKQILSLTRFFGERGATVLFSSQASASRSDDDLQFMADGVVELGHDTTGRTLAVPKFRGSDTKSGSHGLRITDHGMRVFPEVSPSDDGTREYEQTPISSGVPELDELLHGGLERGTVTVLSGPTGVGKTTLGSQFMKEAAGRDERSAIYMFEEATDTFLTRSEAINVPVERMRDKGVLAIEAVEALNRSPQEFAQRVRHDVTEEGTELVMIDGIPGYKQSIRGTNDDLVRRLHQLTRYLTRQGVTVILTEEVGSVTGEFEATGSNVSYLADNIVFLRYIEVRGDMRKAIGVLKKRASDFETRLREFRITEYGLKVGEPLTGMRAILSGTPEMTEDATSQFLPSSDDGGDDR